MEKVKKAEEIARKYHKGQKRENSEDDYIEHPKRVAELVKKITDNEELICVAWLHDTIEGTAIFSPDKLKELEEEIRDLSPNILEEVKALSHNGEDYFEYIEKIAKNKRLRIIKICDIIDNISDNPKKEQIEKYKKALVIFLREEDRKI